MRKVDLDTAAEYFGISSDAVRKRIKRGKLDSIRESGQLYVLIPDNQSENIGQELEKLRQENERLWGVVNAQIDIINKMSDTVALLEAPKKKQSFWRRLFSGGSDG